MACPSLHSESDSCKEEKGLFSKLNLPPVLSGQCPSQCPPEPQCGTEVLVYFHCEDGVSTSDGRHCKASHMTTRPLPPALARPLQATGYTKCLLNKGWHGNTIPKVTQLVLCSGVRDLPGCPGPVRTYSCSSKFKSSLDPGELMFSLRGM